MDPGVLKLDGRYSHLDQIRERLNFFRFLLKVSVYGLCLPAPFFVLLFECEILPFVEQVING